MSIFNVSAPNYEGEGQSSTTTSTGLLGSLSLDLFGAVKPTYVGEGQPTNATEGGLSKLLSGLLDGLLFTAPETKYLAAPSGPPGRPGRTPDPE